MNYKKTDAAKPLTKGELEQERPSQDEEESENVGEGGKGTE